MSLGPRSEAGSLLGRPVTPEVTHARLQAIVFVKGFPAGAWGTNCYAVATAEGEDCIVVDPGQASMGPLMEILERHRLRPVAVLLTHGHLDHVWSVAPLTAGKDIPAYIHGDDRYRLEDIIGTTFSMSRDQLMQMTEGALELTEPEDVRILTDGEQMSIAGVPLTVSHAPGHTEGSVAFIAPRDDQRPPVMISGDLLFAGSIGRTDLPGGDPRAMTESLRRVVLPLDDDTVVLPGHGETTTIGRERALNPYLQDLGTAPAPRGL